ncbi:MAG TPA: hypothetical protein VHK44_03795 [Xanthobacteraceae bacterium]|nr:hypothetical protein [Xanthobacteraceae bacterium]
MAGVLAPGRAGVGFGAAGCCAKAEEIVKAAIDVVAMAAPARATGLADAKVKRCIGSLFLPF